MMGKDFVDFLIPAALAAAPILGPGAAGVAGSGLFGATPVAAPAYGAFGSANMLAAGAAGMAPQIAGLGAAGAAGAAGAESLLPPMTDDLIANGLWDGVGAIPNQIESVKGLDFINGVPQNFGAGVEQFTNNLFDGNFKMPQFGQQQEQNRPAAITSQIKPVGRMAPREPEQTVPSYGADQQEYLTPEQMWERELLRRQMLAQQMGAR